MRRVRFNKLAAEELQDAAVHYEGERAGLGSEFVDEVEKSLAFVAEFPRVAVREGGSYRRLVVPRFPYYIVYRLVGEDVLRILAVGHQKRRPRYWAGRR